MAGCECCDNFFMIDGGDEFKAFPGLKGDDGTTFYPHVSADGVLSWTNDGGKQNPDPVNIKGADGKSAYAAAVEAGFTGTEAEFDVYLSGIGDLTDEVADQKSAIAKKAGILRDTASGAIASFTPDATIDNLLGVSVAVEPVQDLHGYDNPWPAGGSNNKYNEATRASGMLNVITGEVTFDGTWSVSDFIDATAGDITLSWDSDSRPYRANYCVYNASKTFISGTSYVGGIEYSHTFALPAGTAFVRFSWSVAVDGVVVQKTNVRVNSGSADLGYLPYENLCPITGWSVVGIEATGVNLCDEVFELGAIVNGNNYSSQNNLRTKNHIPVVGEESYYSTCPAEIILFQYDKDKTLIRQGNQPYIAVPSGTSFVVTEGTRYIRFYTQPAYGTTYNNDISINYPSTDHAYHAYAGNTYAIQLGQTVYGGVLDATNGVLTIDRAKYTYQGTEDAVLTQVGTYGYRIGFDLPLCRIPQTIQERLEGMSNIMYPSADVTTASRYTPGTFQFYPRSSGQYCACLCVVPLEYNTVGLAKQWLVDNGFEVVYKLAAPITITLDPVTISTISGQTNNVWADAGDVSVEFAADIKAYIDRMNQSPEDDMIANTLIAANKYFTVNNRLFLSTASIAAGAQIIPGHNCTETSLVEALNALNA